LWHLACPAAAAEPNRWATTQQLQKEQMNMAIQDKKSATVIQKWWIEIIVTLLFLGVILFATSGKLTWLMAWVYLAMVLVIKVANALTIDSSLMEERAQPKEGTKKWDIFLASFVAVVGPVFTLILAGLDIRFGWSQGITLAFQIVGAVFVTLGGLLVNWAMAVNQFFSSTVRIQADRNHSVSTQGPYQYVRHPGYVGAIIGSIMTPLTLGSWVAFIPAILVMCGYIVRTGLEDRVLQNELEGYTDYAKKVRYRLFPGIW
jgi:protein-S-isoprenylcysteine O-methyltransferase Ste14